MKRVLFLALACLMLAPSSFAQSNRKKLSDGAIAAEKKKGGEEIQWLSLDEVQVAMKKEPRKVWIDVYTDWCGWCKHMDRTTFSNPHVIKYLNEHFYAVKLDAEQKTDIRFLGKFYQASPTERTHPFATELLHGAMSYPTSVVMQENFRMPQPIPGYQDVKTMEMILKYFGEGIYMKTPWAEYERAFKPSWL